MRMILYIMTLVAVGFGATEFFGGTDDLKAICWFILGIALEGLIVLSYLREIINKPAAIYHVPPKNYEEARI